MIRRAIFIGIAGGIVLSLAALYPIVGVFAPLWFDNWSPPVANFGFVLPDDVVHAFWLMGSTVLAAPTVLGIGIFAAKSAQGWREGGKAGIVAGITVATICYFTIILPANTLAAFGNINESLALVADQMLPSTAVLQTYVSSFDDAWWQGEVALVVAALFWGAQGALLGWWENNKNKNTDTSLFEFSQRRINPKKYFAHNESHLQAGIVVGLLVAVLTAVTASGWSYLAWEDWPELVTAMQNAQMLVAVGNVKNVVGILSPFLTIFFLGFGVLVIILIKEPVSWFFSRFWGIVVAAISISLSFVAVLLRLTYLNFGLTPFWLLREQEALQADPDYSMYSEQITTMVDEGFRNPTFLLVFVLIAPWFSLLIALMMGFIIGIVHSLIYIPILSAIRPRPVDQARTIHRRIKQDPNQLLPLVYTLFKEEEDPYGILAHLAGRTWKSMPDVAHFAAAYHTLGSVKQEASYSDAMCALKELLLRNRQWHWALDFAGAYNTLHQVLNARSLEQILKIEPPPDQLTSSLPPTVVKTQQRLGRVVMELQKVEKTDDLPTKLIFLENALASIHEAQLFVEKEFANPEYWTTPLPQYRALQISLAHWEQIVLTAVKRLKGRADINSYIHTQHCTLIPEMPIMLTVANQGLNVAQQVRVKLLPGEDYDLADIKSESLLEILPPGEKQDVKLMLLPHEGLPRLRLTWEVVYDDAVTDQRRTMWGDKIEFVNSQRPFTRIFPIPYVTGTPLKTDDVFVGREDVFGFVQEMLVGAHQNNVVILHGQRRTGKTSVLYRLPQMLGDTHYAVLIDMQGKPARGEAEFLYAIADDIVFALEDNGIQVPLPERAEFEENPEFFFRSRFLRSLRSHLNGKHLLLMFDEFEELQRRVEDGRLQPEIFHFLRNLMQHEENVDFVLAGTHKLEELGAEYWSALFNMAAYRPITFLRPLEMRRLILQPIEPYNTEYDPLAVDRIINLTAGHPYFAQLLLHEMMVYHNEMKASYLTAVDVDQVAERIIDRGEAHFRYIWDESTADEQRVLQGMAELLACSEGVTAKELRACLEEQGLQSADRWKSALTSLENRDILARNDAKSPLYRFRVNLIQLWLERSRPLG